MESWRKSPTGFHFFKFFSAKFDNVWVGWLSAFLRIVVHSCWWFLKYETITCRVFYSVASLILQHSFRFGAFPVCHQQNILTHFQHDAYSIWCFGFCVRNRHNISRQTTQTRTHLWVGLRVWPVEREDKRKMLYVQVCAVPEWSETTTRHITRHTFCFFFVWVHRTTIFLQCCYGGMQMLTRYKNDFTYFLYDIFRAT